MILPKHIALAKVPPIKIQGIKTKLVPFIAASVQWEGKGIYYEPFMGSGVVGFNLAPKRAVFSDTNPHLIQFYQDIQDGIVRPDNTRDYLEREGLLLAQTPADKSSYYYEVRERFNRCPNSFDFLFLQRANFNGMLRYNTKGQYNVPFGRKPQRFQPALITKICNQIHWVSEVIQKNQWQFVCRSFEETLYEATAEDFIYLDPPYIGRYDGYYDAWSNEKAEFLAQLCRNTTAGFAFSMWLKNKYRINPHMSLWDFGELLTTEHFYHIGASERNRHAMTEALVVSPAHVSHSVRGEITVLNDALNESLV